MESNRIGQFLGFAPKVAQTANASEGGKGGFADLLFGVMNKRISTVTSLLPGNRVSTVLPMSGTPVAAVATGSGSGPQPTDKAGSASPAIRGSAPASEPQPGRNTKQAGHQSKDEVDAAGAGQELSPANDPAGATPETDRSDEEPAGLENQGEGQGEGNADSGGTETPPDGTAALAIAAQAEPSAAAGSATVVALAQPAAAAVTATEAAGADDAAVSPAAPAEPGADGDGETQPAQPQIAAGPVEDHEAFQMADADGQPQMPAAAQSASAQSAAAQSASVPAHSTGEAGGEAIPFALAVEPLVDKAAQAGLAARPGDGREDPAAMFRQSQQSPKQRPAATGQGTANGPAQPGAQTAPAAGAPASAAAAAATTAIGVGPSTLLPFTPLGDMAFGPAAGLTGLQLALAQGAARRGDLVANLRQHLQNLPTHDQLAVGIQRAARDGSGRISLQLSPTELGRIHVKLDIDQEKNVRASVSVERPATLELLQRDTKALERALQDAGLKMDQNDLSFSLHGGNSQSFTDEFGTEGNGATGPLDIDGDGDDDGNDLPAMPPAILATGEGMVDVQI